MFPHKNMVLTIWERFFSILLKAKQRASRRKKYIFNYRNLELKLKPPFSPTFGLYHKS